MAFSLSPLVLTPLPDPTLKGQLSLVGASCGWQCGCSLHSGTLASFRNPEASLCALLTFKLKPADLFLLRGLAVEAASQFTFLLVLEVKFGRGCELLLNSSA